jgi:polyribonucleotide nucleotidyltransferase
MNQAWPSPRAELSQYAPRIITLKVPIDKIGEIIGPGGKMIRSIIEETGAKIDIEDDGTVLIASVDQAAGEAARDRVLGICEEPEVGKVYEGKVRRVTDFGAFVQILPNTDGLLHISELEYYRVNRVEDIVNVGDTVKVKVLEIDNDGKIRLSRKALMPKPDRPMGGDGGDDRTSRPNRRGR